MNKIPLPLRNSGTREISTPAGHGFGSSWKDPTLPASPTEKMLGKSNPATVIDPISGLTSTHIVADLEMLVEGKGGKLRSDFVRGIVRDNTDWDPDNLPRVGMDWTKRAKLHDRVIKLLNNLKTTKREAFMNGTLETSLLMGKDDDEVTMLRGAITTVKMMRDEMNVMGVTLEELSALDNKKKDKFCLRLEKRICEKHPLCDPKVRAGIKRLQMAVAALHEFLEKDWARKPLIMEPVRASWLKYLQEFDRQSSADFIVKMSNGKPRLVQSPDLQSIVVENDWGAAVPPALTGEWHTPFPECAWEFHLSGVRVMALTNEWDDGRIGMVLCYGLEGVWASDDYRYDDIRNLSRKLTPVRMPYRGHGSGVEFDLVAAFAARLIRSTCIMMDAEVAQFERVSAGGAHREMRGRGNRPPTPLRDHYVVRLIGHKNRRYNVARSGGASVGDARAPQRGHWRQGTWVHFDDPDSGREQYANDGGFIVSKTWRRWHFAGDPNNIIHKEYRA